jgi:hypothetical protein
MSRRPFGYTDGGDRLLRSESGQPMHPQNARIPRLRPAVRGERGRIWLPGDDDLSVTIGDRCVHDRSAHSVTAEVQGQGLVNSEHPTPLTPPVGSMGSSQQ